MEHIPAILTVLGLAIALGLIVVTVVATVMCGVNGLLEVGRRAPFEEDDGEGGAS